MSDTTNVEGRKPEGAPERSPNAGEGAASGVDGNVAKRFSGQRKMAVVARMLRGEPLELVARETNVSIARLSEWRERALAGAATALKERERDVGSAACLKTGPQYTLSVSINFYIGRGLFAAPGFRTSGPSTKTRTWMFGGPAVSVFGLSAAPTVGSQRQDRTRLARLSLEPHL